LNALLSFVKQYFLRLKLKNAIRENLPTRATLNFGEVKSVGVFFVAHDDEKQKHIGNFIRTLQRDGKQVSCLTYFGKERDIAYAFDHDFFMEDEIDLRGGFLSNAVNNFINKPFDYLYCISTDQSEVQDLIMCLSRAKCRIGPYQPGREHLYELMLALKPGEDVDKLVEQALHYTRAIAYN
jgi:hypothetical protein